MVVVLQTLTITYTPPLFFNTDHKLIKLFLIYELEKKTVKTFCLQDLFCLQTFKQIDNNHEIAMGNVMLGQTEFWKSKGPKQTDTTRRGGG